MLLILFEKSNKKKIKNLFNSMYMHYMNIFPDPIDPINIEFISNVFTFDFKSSGF